jgi:cobaltochelatase CobS
MASHRGTWRGVPVRVWTGLRERHYCPTRSAESQWNLIHAHTWGEVGNRKNCAGIPHPNEMTDDEYRDATTAKAGENFSDPPVSPILKSDAPTSDATAAALANLIATLTPTQSIDETTVRAMVDQAMGEVLGDRLNDAVKHLAPQVVRIEVPDMPVKELTGNVHESFPIVVKLLALRRHVFLVGPAGTGKSTIGEQAADALSLPFQQLSLSPDSGRHELFGFIDARGEYVSTGFRETYENGGVFVLDEIDNGTAEVLAALNSALANHGVNFPDGHVKRHDNFRIIATGNTAGTGATVQFIGRQQLDFATLDRFEMVRVAIDEAMEAKIAHALLDDVPQVSRVLADVRGWRKNAETHKVWDVSLSPRRVYSVCSMVAGGIPLTDAYAMAIWKGATDEQIRKVRGS